MRARRITQSTPPDTALAGRGALLADEKKRHLRAASPVDASRRDAAQRDIMFMLTLCITHSVPTIRIAAVSTV